MTKVSCNIRVLEDSVINKIAAGEVVERPVSIVRELVDNAIDANATSVEVLLIEGGQELIRVRDNGSGMSAEEAKLSFSRHATSKIRTVDDLEAIETLGFRGEALSSIAAVAKVQLKTQREDQSQGAELQVEDGKILLNKVWHGSTGTEFEVSRLFANMPARKKFLKSPRSDTAKITDWIYSSALAHPNIRYKLSSGNTEILFLPEHRDIFERLQALISGTLIKVNFKAGPFSVKGYVAHPSQVDSRLSNLVFLVNARPVTDKMLLRAVRDAWSTGLRPGEYPVGALEINLPNSEVDINVHPQKSEVRFRNSQAVFGTLYKAIKLALAEWQPESQLPSLLSEQKSIYSESVTNDPGQMIVAETSQQLAFKSDSNFQSLKFLGQVLGAFLLFERDARVFIVDAHAAHERVRFNQLKDWAGTKQKNSQLLLLPEILEFDRQTLASLSEKKQELENLGFDFTENENSLSIKQYPSELKISELSWFLNSIAQADYEDLTNSLVKIIETSLARSACRSSVMSGQMLSSYQAIELWNKIQTEPQGAVCPHGRPVMRELTREQLDSMFLRDGF